eukprot:2560056-Pyramimonas_sp.AAC.1
MIGRGKELVPAKEGRRSKEPPPALWKEGCLRRGWLPKSRERDLALVGMPPGEGGSRGLRRTAFHLRVPGGA